MVQNISFLLLWNLEFMKYSGRFSAQEKASTGKLVNHLHLDVSTVQAPEISQGKKMTFACLNMFDDTKLFAIFQALWLFPATHTSALSTISH